MSIKEIHFKKVPADTTCQQTSAEAGLHCSQSALSLLTANFSLPNFSR